MFDDAVLRQVASVAKLYNLDLAALLAVVEVESAGKALEIDGKTPSFLFEKHIFYRELRALCPAKLDTAVAEGLAFRSWDPRTEYRNEATSSQRLALFAKAKALHPEAAYRSASWGVGQTMGFCFRELGFVDAAHMLDFMIQGGIPAQVECMVREIEHKKLAAKLNGHDWAGFALFYNGAGYKRNAYDTRLGLAYARWKPKAPAIAALAPPPQPSPAPSPPPAPKPVAQPPARPAPQANVFASIVAALRHLFGGS